MKHARYILTLILVVTTHTLWAQSADELDALPENQKGIAPAMAYQVQVGKDVINGQTVPAIILPTLYKYPDLNFKNNKERERYNRLVANVKRLLPIAKMAKYTIIETYEVVSTMKTKKEREAHIRAVEAELRHQYTPILKKLTRSQGRLLVKLIDRECNQTGYNIAKAFVGSFRANMYQTIAFCFGQSLNKKYDPEGDDSFTERVVRMVESGQL